MKATVYYTTTASALIQVDIPDDTPEDERISVARQMADEELDSKGLPGLCWSCSNTYDLGEVEQERGPDSVDFEVTA